TYRDEILAEHSNPVMSVNNSLLASSDTRTASYYSAQIHGDNVKDIAWYYVDPKTKASHIKDHVAFYKNKVTIE
ncbi:DUF427-domain-containing protein, partial [Suillus fuscotomentosus]